MLLGILDRDFLEGLEAGDFGAGLEQVGLEAIHSPRLQTKQEHGTGQPSRENPRDHASFSDCGEPLALRNTFLTGGSSGP